MAKKHKISFGEFSEQIGKEEHELLDKELELLKKDFKELELLKKEIKSEEDLIGYFEKKIKALLRTLTYLDGYITRIEEGDTLLKKHPSVERLGNELAQEIEEVEALSKSLMSEEQKSLGLGRQVKEVLEKAKKYQEMIFE